MSLAMSSVPTNQTYCSFTSLVWARGGRAHAWVWHGYEVWGVGLNEQGKGGRWFAKGPGFWGDKQGYTTEFDARAAAEAHELEVNEPAIAIADVRMACRHLSEDVAVGFDWLLAETGLDEGRLSDALAAGYDLDVVFVSVVPIVGYKLEGTAESRERKLAEAEKAEAAEIPSIVEMVMEANSKAQISDSTVAAPWRSAERELLARWETEREELAVQIGTLENRRDALTQSVAAVKALLDVEAVVEAETPLAPLAAMIEGAEFSGMETAAAAMLFLKLAGTSQTNREIAEGIAAGGWQATAKDPAGAVRSALTRVLNKPDSEVKWDGERWELKQ